MSRHHLFLSFGPLLLSISLIGVRPAQAPGVIKAEANLVLVDAIRG